MSLSNSSRLGGCGGHVELRETLPDFGHLHDLDEIRMQLVRRSARA
jgi:hypothetical protein